MSGVYLRFPVLSEIPVQAITAQKKGRVFARFEIRHKIFQCHSGVIFAQMLGDEAVHGGVDDELKFIGNGSTFEV